MLIGESVPSRAVRVGDVVINVACEVDSFFEQLLKVHSGKGMESEAHLKTYDFSHDSLSEEVSNFSITSRKYIPVSIVHQQ